MAKIVGRIPVKELRRRMRRPEKPLKVSVGSVLKKALAKK